MKYNYDERQLRALCFTASLAPVSRLLPKATARIAGSGSWIAPLIALPILLIFILLLSQFMKMRRDGEGLGELVLRTGGSVFGGFTLVFLSAFMIFEGGFILRSAANRFISTIYPAAEPWFFIAIMLIMGAVASLGAVKALPRAARIFAPVLVAVLLLTLFFAFSQVEPSKLLPISRSDTPDLFLSSLVVVEIYAGMLIFTAVLEDQCQRRDRFKSLALWIVPICLLLTAFCAAIIGSYGADIAAGFSSPFFSMVRDVTLFRTVERIEALVAALWVMSDFTLLALLLIASRHLLRLVFGFRPEKADVPMFSMKNGRWLIVACAALSAVAAALIPADETQLSFISQYIIPSLSLITAFVILPVWFILSRRSSPKGQFGGGCR